jgi:glutamyl-tRNA(Gln) amidotransferase subunit E
MGMDIIDEVHIARKQYLDGSIPTGFQRTAIVGVNGCLPFKGRKLRVTHLSVEEDSCREVLDKGHRIIFRTDRLGMPLTETVTGPDLRTPEEVRDAILLCGLVARSTGHVRVGIGAARQDVNVSVRGGDRVEIKGVPRAGYAVKLVRNEAIRQVNLLKLRDKLGERGLRSPDDIRMRACDVSDILACAEVEYLRRALSSGGRIYGIRVDGVADLALHPTQPDTTFVDELSGRVRVIACLDEHPILLHSAGLPECAKVHQMRDRLRKRLRVGEIDDFFVVWGPEADCVTAAEEIRLRFGDATQGVPRETRQALPGGFTTFERILPGPNRMYPDTDSPPTKITRERVEKLRRGLPPAPWERQARYSAWGLPEESIHYLIRRRGAELVDTVVRETGVDGLTAAIEIAQRGKALRRAGIPVDRLGAEEWVGIFNEYTDGRIPREGIQALAAFMAKNPGATAEQARAAVGIELWDRSTWQRELDRITLAGYRGGKGDGPARRLRYLAGQATKMLRGHAPAKEVVALLDERLKEVSP